MDLRGWWSGHVRPRDLFALACLVALATLCLAVWTSGIADAAVRKDVIVDALGIVAGLNGFYSGARVADRASDRARDEVQDARHATERRERELDEATALVTALQRQIAALREQHQDEEES